MAIEIFPDFTVTSDVGTDANSYVSVEQCKAVWSLDPYKQNTSYTDEDIGRAVILATKQINLQYGPKFKGVLFDNTYALFFPRTGIEDSRGVAISDFTIFPTELSEATALMAWYSINENRSKEISVSGIKSQKMDGVGGKEYFSPAQQKSISKSLIPEEVSMSLSTFISTGTNKYSSFLGRG